jgi:hypothetical protein
MSFEEEFREKFPSLIGLPFRNVAQHDVFLHCLDKQLVREAFDDEIGKGLPKDALVIVEILKQRLGL